jgi:hypothetical protein
MKLQEIVYKVSEELNLPPELVEKTYKAYWYSIRSMISELPLKDIKTEEEFNRLKPNFNIPSIGKLSITWERFKGLQKRFEYIKHLKEKQC